MKLKKNDEIKRNKKKENEKNVWIEKKKPK